ncbi:glycosyltransferase [Butyrivibrio sp. CB08]|nr:glycosyltransferase [Butyrivibrio sp. CB08]
MLLGLLAIKSTSYANEDKFIHARPSVNGQLSVEGTQLVDKNGSPVLLKGISTHGLTWFPDFIDEDIFRQLATEWDCNLIRLPMYSEIYCDGEERLSEEMLRKGVDLAIKNDMYVMVDWHILNDYDPNMNIDEAMDFFSRISSDYAGVPNIIYEICNEPNGSCSWSDVYEYSNKVIPVIRENSPDAVVLVGTTTYDRDLIIASRNPLSFDNVMYVLHFYTATHRSDLQGELLEALDRGLPVFISECGICEASGDGAVDYASAAKWFDILHEHGISYAIWSLSNKDESSAMLKPEYDPKNPMTDADLSPSGTWVKALVQGQAPDQIPIPSSEEKISILPPALEQSLSQRDIMIAKNWPVMALCILIFEAIAFLIVTLHRAITSKKNKTYETLDAIESTDKNKAKEALWGFLRRIVLLLSVFFTLMYLCWRMSYSLPVDKGPIAVTANIMLLIVEVFGFIESLILYVHLLALKDHPLPKISDEEFPDVDIFIATYNEPSDLLSKTINACNHLSYPDKSKVHVWLCDDNRRSEMRALAESMGIGYFDRPDNKGAKAGNLNNALGKTSAPYVVTLDADMLVKSDFLLKTIPYFVDAKKRSESLPENKKIKLGLLQTPQCFYEPDIFQFALYSETSAPNEQDFFYRTIEVAKTSTNSVIYGGSNTVIAREALEAIGGFYTETITEDFATGLLIESNGFVSLALPEPLASGKTPDTFKEHIKQRIRWGRGVISTARQLHLFRRKGLTFAQRMSYWSSVVYWYSPVKNLIYMISPLVFAVFAIPVFKCSWMDLLMFWAPMFIMQDLCLRAYSKNAVSLKWSGIYETSVMPHLLVPITKEFFGITTKKFAVTDKSAKKVKRGSDLKSMWPYILLISLSIVGIIRCIAIAKGLQSLSVVILIFWIIRNMYFLAMSMFLEDGRDSEADEVHVIDAEPVVMTKRADGSKFEGITTFLTEHSLKIFLDEAGGIVIGDMLDVNVETMTASADLGCVVTGITPSRSGVSAVYSVEILDTKGNENEYQQILFDRVPTLPQSLSRDYGIFNHLFKNIAHRILR